MEGNAIKPGNALTQVYNRPLQKNVPTVPNSKVMLRENPPRPQKQQSVDVVVRKEKPQRRPVPSPVRDPRPVRGSSDRSPFSRYPVRVPQTSSGPSDHFSLPIDSLANINIRPQQRTGPAGAGSFEDTLTKMLQDLGELLTKYQSLL